VVSYNDDLRLRRRVFVFITSFALLPLSLTKSKIKKEKR